MSLIKTVRRAGESATGVGALKVGSEVVADKLRLEQQKQRVLREGADASAYHQVEVEKRRKSRNRMIGAVAAVVTVAAVGTAVFDHETSRGEAFLQSLFPHFAPKTITQLDVRNTIKNMHLTDKPIVAESTGATTGGVIRTTAYTPDFPVFGRQRIPGMGSYTPDKLTDDLQAVLNNKKVTFGYKQEKDQTYGLVLKVPDDAVALQTANAVNDFTGATDGLGRRVSLQDSQVSMFDTVLSRVLPDQQMNACKSTFGQVIEQAIKSSVGESVTALAAAESGIPGVDMSKQVIDQFAKNPVTIEFYQSSTSDRTSDVAKAVHTPILANQLSFQVPNVATSDQVAAQVNFDPSEFTLSTADSECLATPTAVNDMLKINGVAAG